MADEILEAPVELSEVDTVDTETADTEAAEDSAEGSESQSEGSESGSEGSESAGADANAPLWKQAKPLLKEIQAKNPGLAAKIKTALIEEQRMRTALPNGLKEVEESRAAMAEIADQDYQGKSLPEQVKLAKDEITFWRDFDRKLSAGDPAVLDNLYEVAPDAALALSVKGFSKFAEKNPDGYSAYVAQVVAADMNSASLPVQFQILKAFLPQLQDGPAKDQVIAAINEIYAWSDRMNALAKKPVLPEKKTDPNQPNPKQQQDLESRELNVRRQEWNMPASQFGNNLLSTELQRIAGKASVTAEQKAKILSQVAEEWDARLTANRAAGDALRSFLKNGDRDGYMKKLKSEYQRIIPGAVRRAYDDNVKAAPAAKKAAAPTPKEKVVTGGGNKGTEAMVRFSKYPTGQVDVMRTTQTMLAQKKAVLKDGRTATWQ